MARHAFGEQRTIAQRRSLAERLLYRVMGVPDPAHYLHHRILRRALDAEPQCVPRRILDAGCGRGDHTFYLARRFPDAEVLGVDVDEQRVEGCRAAARALRIANVRFEVADLADAGAGWRAEPYELIVSIDALEHIVEQERALRNLASALAPGGIALLHIPTARTRPVPFSRLLTAFRAWAVEEHVAEDRTADEFVRLVARQGLEIVRVRRTFGYWTGELATSLFALPFRPTARNRVLQALLAPACRILTLADGLGLDQTRYAVAITARQPAGTTPGHQSPPGAHPGKVPLASE